MKKFLLYCPDLGGHRQVYCNVFADWALTRGYEVILIYAGNFYYREGKLLNEPLESPYINYYKNQQHIQLINALEQFENLKLGWEFDYIGDLQKQLKPDLTILADGIVYVEPASILEAKTPGRLMPGNTICVNLGTEFYYQGWLQRRRGLKRLKNIRSFDKYILFDEYLCAELDPSRFCFLPDIGMSFNMKLTDHYQKEVMEEYRAFVDQHSHREIVFYFGPANRRKGYDMLLRLVSGDPNLVFVHCGKLDQDIARETEIIELRDNLKSSRRIFELNEFVIDPAMITEFFNSPNFMIMGHHHYPLTSGTMIQALFHNKPLIVPQGGLMARRVKDNKLGVIYKDGSLNDLLRQVKLMSVNWEQYVDPVIRYKELFCRESVFNYLDRALT
ncbi:hypothetical protein JW877_02770 [bacterium]|nr:hypothetical protein [bacterium]